MKGRACLIVGGGSVAERKALNLLKTGAAVKVVSPTLTARLEKEKVKGRIKHLRRRFREDDLRGVSLVVAATDSEDENIRISGAVKAALKDTGCAPFLNVVDRPGLCDFIVPSVVKRGPLQIAVSTSGASPATAKAIRKEIERLYGPEVGKRLSRLMNLRREAMAKIKDPVERSLFFKSLSAEVLK